jgi:hypothetical protein
MYDRSSWCREGLAPPELPWADFEIDEVNLEKNPMQFTLEADHFRLILSQRPRNRGEEDLRDMKYIEQIYGVVGEV